MAAVELTKLAAAPSRRPTTTSSSRSHSFFDETGASVAGDPSVRSEIVKGASLADARVMSHR